MDHSCICSLGLTKFADQDKQLTIQARVPLGTAANGATVGLLLPARDAARRAQGSNNLKQFGLALHMYHGTHNELLATAIRDKEKRKALLSWRVAILPFLQQQLYQKFYPCDDWNFEHNKKLIEQMPVVW